MSKKYKLKSQGNYRVFKEGVIYDECAKSSTEPDALSVAFFANKYPNEWEEVVVKSPKFKVGDMVRILRDDGSCDYNRIFNKGDLLVVSSNTNCKDGYTKVSEINPGWGNIEIENDMLELIKYDYACPHSGESFMKEDAHYTDIAIKASERQICFKAAGVVTEFKDCFIYSHTKEGIIKWRNMEANSVSATNKYTTLTFWMKNKGATKEAFALFGSKKPPLGLIPKSLHRENRYDEVFNAIARYFNAGLPVPKEWVEEFNELGDAINKREKVGVKVEGRTDKMTY